MGRRLGLCALLAMMSASQALAAPWLQAGYDPARTSATSDSGPATPDVAWMVRLTGGRYGNTGPLLLSGAAYVPLGDEIIGDEVITVAERGIWRIPLDEPVPQRIIATEFYPEQLATDGERLFIEDGPNVWAYLVEGGEPLWTWEAPALISTVDVTSCSPFAVVDGVLYVPCRQDAVPPGAAVGLAAADEHAAYIAALDAATGQERWLWVRDAAEQAREQFDLPVPAVPAYRTVNVTGNPSIAVLGGYVVAVAPQTQRVDANDPASEEAARLARLATASLRVWALSVADGSVVWRGGSPKAEQFLIEGAPTLEGLDDVFPLAPHPTGSDNLAVLKLDRLVAVNPAQGGLLLWEADIGQDDFSTTGEGRGFALAGEALYVASAQTLYRFSVDDGHEVWKRTLEPSLNEFWGSWALVYANDTLYARSFRVDPERGGELPVNAMYAIDPESGAILWRRELVRLETVPAWPLGGGFRYSVGEGVLAIAGQDGTLRVIGATRASLELRTTPTTLYPEVGGLASVDLSGTRAGFHGPATEFRAEWGDGATTDWQSSPVLTHAFDERGDVTPRFFARNPAGQEASRAFTFHVGESPPTALQQAFSPENQDRTFFLVGLTVTGTAAIVGVARLRRRRGRLKQELASIEEAYATTMTDPVACEAMLRERRARAHGLLLDGKIEEAHVTVLDKRIEDLGRRLRLGQLDERFDYLPRGMVRRLEDMLSDGHITRWEREHFIDALERDQLLTPEQKEKVRRLVDGWFARDNTVS